MTWSQRDSLITSDGRFQLEDYPTGSSDHFMHPELEWKLIDTRENKTLAHFYGDDMSGPNWADKIAFSEDETQILLINRENEIIRKIDIKTACLTTDELLQIVKEKGKKILEFKGQDKERLFREYLINCIHERIK